MAVERGQDSGEKEFKTLVWLVLIGFVLDTTITIDVEGDGKRVV